MIEMLGGELRENVSILKITAFEIESQSCILKIAHPHFFNFTKLSLISFIYLFNYEVDFFLLLTSKCSYLSYFSERHSGLSLETGNLLISRSSSCVVGRVIGEFRTTLIRQYMIS